MIKEQLSWTHSPSMGATSVFVLLFVAKLPSVRADKSAGELLCSTTPWATGVGVLMFAVVLLFNTIVQSIYIQMLWWENEQTLVLHSVQPFCELWILVATNDWCQNSRSSKNIRLLQPGMFSSLTENVLSIHNGIEQVGVPYVVPYVNAYEVINP